MNDFFKTPEADLTTDADKINTSGMGKDVEVPDEIKGWSWGAFVFTWLWGIFNGTWVSLLALFPYIGFVMAIVLGVKGREWAWRNKRWDSVERFLVVQKRWSFAASILLILIIVGIVAAVVLPGFHDHFQGG